MRHPLFLAVIAFASAAQGVSLSVDSDKHTYLIGETITLSVFGDDTGAATSYAIQGRLDYSGAIVNNVSSSQIQLVGAFGKWTTVSLPSYDDGNVAWSFAFAQYSQPDPQTADNLPGLLATVTLRAATLGVVNVNWNTTSSTDYLDFFGLTNAPGTSFTVAGPCDGCPNPPPLPEPATGALLALGLLALAAARSRST
jgi:hypothetical protein